MKAIDALPGRMNPRASLAAAIIAMLALIATDVAGAARGTSGGVATDSIRFTVRASWGLFTAKREVTARAVIRDGETRIHVEFDRPFRGGSGLRRITMWIRLFDSAGIELNQLELHLDAGERSLDFSIALPGPGRYTVTLREADVAAGPANIQIQPGGQAILKLDAPDDASRSVGG